MVSDNKIIRVAIDGPAAAGKSTVAKLIAAELNYVYIDTGAMYRALTLKVLKENINVEDERSLTNLLKETELELQASQEGQFVLLATNDVTKEIRNTEASAYHSQNAQVAEVTKTLGRTPE